MLLRIPIPLDMHPENASVIDALIFNQHLYRQVGIPIAARGVLKPWKNQSAVHNTMQPTIGPNSAAEELVLMSPLH